MRFRPNDGVVDIPPASFCSVIHAGIHSYILTTIFRDFPHFIQRSEQIKIEYFCKVCSVKALNESILCRLTQLAMLLEGIDWRQLKRLLNSPTML